MTNSDRQRVLAWRQANRARYNAYQNNYQKTKAGELRQQVVTALGGCCVVCGFDHPLCLDIDHIDGGGKEFRRGKGPMAQWRAMIRSNYEGLQLLCANCHAIKSRSQDGNS